MVDETGGTSGSEKVDSGEILDLALTRSIRRCPPSCCGLWLSAPGEQAVHVPGRAIKRMVGAGRGETGTDAYVFAETARNRQDFAAIDAPAGSSPTSRF
ncbi:hypothetical protein [Streptomyces sp. NPDC102283]|uniref:hypothetical protein n=1 Tax=Streptomyces sp. NPDC102283 TaxID=3366155 RepID=UPI00382B8F9C